MISGSLGWGLGNRRIRHQRGRSILLLQGYKKIHRGLLGTIAIGLFSEVEFGAFTF